MADDILLTPEEQDERAKQWLKDNGIAIVLGVCLGLGAIFGYNQYKANQLKNAQTASQIYNSVLQSFSDSELVDIEDRVETLKSDHTSTSYAAKAVLIRAKQLAVNDKLAAVKELQWVADNANEVGLKHAAQIRLAKLQLALGNEDQAMTIASQQPYDGFASHYYELLGDIAVKKNNLEEARDNYQQAMDSLNDSDSAYRAVLTLKLNQLPEPAVELEEPLKQ